MSDFMLWLEEKGIIEDTAYALEYYSAARLEAITDIYMEQYLASIVNDDIVLPENPRGRSHRIPSRIRFRWPCSLVTLV